MPPSDAVIEGVSGAAAGMTALVITYPLMTISTKQATRSSGERKQEGESVNKGASGTLADIAEILRREGWTGLFQGLQASLLGTAVSQGVYFYFYSLLRQFFVARHQRLTSSRSQDIGVGPSLLVAFLAGCGNVLLTNPIWTVATRMQAYERKKAVGELDRNVRPPGPLEIVREILREEGVTGLWKGVLPSLVMVSNPTVNFMLYETLRSRLEDWRRVFAAASGGEARRTTPADVFLLSAAAKLGATVATYPLLLVKARLQSAGKHTADDRRYTGTLDAIERIWKTEGPLGFYKGMRAKIVQSILAAALLMAVKEQMTTTTAALLNKSVIVTTTPSKATVVQLAALSAPK